MNSTRIVHRRSLRRAHASRAIAGLALAAALTATAAHADPRTAMIALERAYVPALAMTNMPGKVAESRIAIGRLEGAWAAYVKTLERGLAGDKAFAAIVAKTSASVQAASAAAGSGDITKAHETLEHVRGDFGAWRAARGIEYFPDALTRFHDAMEHLVDVAAKRADANGRREAYALARSRWIDVERALGGFDAALYGFDAARAGRLREMIAKERALLDDYAAAMVEGERLAAAGRALKGNFAQTYFLFGDFSGLQ